MEQRSKEEILEDEALIILHSGEIPEIAYHSSLYYLGEDPDGPHLDLTEEEKLRLKNCVVQRYKTIIMRDINPRNRDKSIYRGLKRSAINWQRLKSFTSKENMDISSIREEIADRLKEFLHREMDDVKSGARKSCINCTTEEVIEYVTDLGLDKGDLPKGFETLCPAPSESSCK